MPSSSRWGSSSMSTRSLQVPGSLSSALTARKEGRCGSGSLGMKPHLTPVGKPAPPRPRSPEALTSSITASGSPASSTLRAVSQPPSSR